VLSLALVIVTSRV